MVLSLMNGVIIDGLVENTRKWVYINVIFKNNKRKEKLFNKQEKKLCSYIIYIFLDLAFTII